MRREDVVIPPAPTNDRPCDRFRCGASCAGKDGAMQTCSLGPTPQGRCRHEKDPCTPEPTAHLLAKRFRRRVLCCGMIVLFVGMYLWGGEFYKPGKLSTPHAQILSGQLASASCAACHPQAELSPLAWFLSGHREGDAVQTDRCMDCHHTRLPREFARNAHNLAPSELQKLQTKARKAPPVSLARWIPEPAVELDDVACAACHREHAGADASLTSLSDAQCQTCHSNQFKSFAEGHPAWSDWPYIQNEPIAFDHRSHANRHFPAHKNDDGSAEVFDCLRCHAKTDTGNFARTGDYASTCGECHDQSLNQQSGQRFDLFVLPSLMEPASLGLHDWPASATGFYDGAVGPIARLLLQSHSQESEALKSIPGEGNFARIQPANQAQQAAAAVIANAIRERIQEMATQGPVPVASTLQTGGPELAKVIQGLPPQLIWDASQRWFNKSHSSERLESSREARSPYRPASTRQKGDALDVADPLLEDDDAIASDIALDDEPLSGDALTNDVSSENLDVLSNDENKHLQTSRTRRAEKLDFNPTTMQPQGGWYIDDGRMAISYRGHGHADPVLKAAIELAAGLPVESSIRRELLTTGPAVGCIQCHQAVTIPGKLRWKPDENQVQQKRTLTKFNHAPHMNLPSLADCRHCHSMDDQITSISNVQSGPMISSVSTSESAVTEAHDFLPMTKHQCAACHTAAAAGDACVKCHRYHTDSLPSLR